VTCPSTAKFNTISAAAHVAGMNPGWNVGNTLDAVETVQWHSLVGLWQQTKTPYRRALGTTHL
jgi:hypothetical protein